MFVALPSGAYRYDAAAHALQLVAASDLRRVTGYQDFVDEAPLDLVYRGRPRADGPGAGGAARVLRLGRGRRDRAERLPVRCAATAWPR